MFDLNSISAAKSKASQNYEKVGQDIEEILSKGISYFQEFSGNHSVKSLRKAMDNFFSFIEHKRSKPEPFFYIAFSAYLLGEKELADKYLNYTKQVDPDFPHLNKLKLLINKK